MRRKTAYQAYRDGDTVVINYSWLDKNTVEVRVVTRDGRVGKFKAKKLHREGQEILEDEELV